MIGKTIAHYKITEELGRGGMGVVYRARDTKLGRAVAIKFLSQHLGSDPEAVKRFVNEAKAASALDHQHIGTIYEANETDDGLTYIVMAYYEGETLRERIDRGGIELNEAIDIACQITDGLAKAHEKSIVHRDIKPSNIIITKDGVVKILDFGLAKLMGSTKITRTGSTMGTAAYMSPEQAQGEAFDHRSDIFSFGSILYEMISGERSFKGEHEAALLYSIVYEDPEPLERKKPDCPQGLIDVVDHAMEKKAEDRYQSTEAISNDLRNLKADEAYLPGKPAANKGRFKDRRFAAGLIMAGIVAVAAIMLYIVWPSQSEIPETRKVVAVLPFQNIGSPEDEYFADGLTEEIIARLAKVKGIGVIASAVGALMM